MKREEKNLISRKKIRDSALKEFADKGYGASSVNTICSEGGISKGILYHYYKDKDELYLACVRECFEHLTAYMENREFSPALSDMQKLNRYFEARFAFFEQYPLYQKIFCNAVVMPPEHLKKAIGEIREEFDRMNLQLLEHVLSHIELRSDVSHRDVIETFSHYQDFINAKYQRQDATIDAKAREESCRKALSILIYGVIRRGEEFEQ